MRTRGVLQARGRSHLTSQDECRTGFPAHLVDGADVDHRRRCDRHLLGAADRHRPKLALVPFLEITAPLDAAAKRTVVRRMLVTAATVALVLMALGELLRAFLHFTVGALSIAGGVILFVLAVAMVLGQDGGPGHLPAGKDPLQLAQFPLAVPYLLNPVGIVGLVTISAELDSVAVFAVAVGILGVVLLIDVAVFRWANQVGAKLDEGRMLVTEKVFGFLIAAIGVQLVLDGLESLRGHCARRALNRRGRRLGCSVREVEDGLDVVGLAGVGVGPSADRRLAGDEPGEPRRVGLGEGVGGELVVVPVGVDRTEQD